MKRLIVWVMVVVFCLLCACSSPVTGESEWTCTKCGKQTSSNFCSECGAARSEASKSESSKTAAEENSTKNESSTVEDKSDIESYVYLKNDGTLWLTPKNADKPIQIGKSYEGNIDNVRISADGKYVYLQMMDSDVVCADIEEITRGNEEWIKVDGCNSVFSLIDGNVFRSDINYHTSTTGYIPEWYLDGSKKYVFYTVKNESDEISLLGIYLNSPESSKILKEHITSVLDASDPEHVLVRGTKNEWSSQYNIYDVGFDHDPVCVMENVYESWNMNGHIFAVVEGRRVNSSLPGYGDLVEYDNSNVTTILTNISKSNGISYAENPRMGGVQFERENDPDGYVLVEDGTLYRVKSESLRISREMLESIENASVPMIFFASNGIFIDCSAVLIHMPVSEGSTTTDIVQIAEYTQGLITENGEFYYVKNRTKEKYENRYIIFGDFFKVDTQGNHELLAEHIFCEDNYIGCTGDFLYGMKNPKKCEGGSAFAYGINENAFLGDYKDTDIIRKPMKIGGRINEEEYIYVSPDGNLYINRNNDTVILDNNVCGVWTPYTSWEDNVFAVIRKGGVVKEQP